jgi:hypothetical protein
VPRVPFVALPIASTEGKSSHAQNEADKGTTKLNPYCIKQATVDTIMDTKIKENLPTKYTTLTSCQSKLASPTRKVAHQELNPTNVSPSNTRT